MLIDEPLLIQLVERAAEQLDTLRDPNVALNYALERQLLWATIGARATVFGFALTALAEARSPRFAWALRESRARAEGFDDRHRDEDLVPHCIERLVALGGAEVLTQTPPLLRSPVVAVRAAVARGLVAHRAHSEAQRQLTVLCSDRDLGVRAAARQVLGPQAPPPWAGLYPADPLAAYPPTQATALAQQLAAAFAALDQGPFLGAKPLTEALAELPDALAAPLLERAFATEHFFEAELARRWLGLPQAGQAVQQAVMSRRGDGFNLAGQLRPVVAELSADARERLLGELALTLSPEPAPADLDTSVFSIQQLIVEGWPAGASLAPILTACLGCEPEEAARRQARADPPLSPLGQVLTRLLMRDDVGFGTALDACWVALEAGFPGAWSPFADMLERALQKQRHPRLRALAERWLSGTARQASFALHVLLDTNYREGVDPPRETLFAQVVADARLRALVVDDGALRKLLGEPLRAQLRAGGLTAQQTAQFARELGAHDPADVEQLRAAAQAATDARCALVLLRELATNSPQAIGAADRALALRWLDAWRAAPGDDEALVDALVVTCDLWPKLQLPQVVDELREKSTREVREHIDLLLRIWRRDAEEDA